MLLPNLRIARAVLPFATLLLAGCGSQAVSGRPATVPAMIAVSYQGSPVAGASVVLVPQEPGGKPAMALTDASGRGKLFTFEPGDGAIVGSYVATVSKSEPTTLSGEEIYAMVERGQTPPEPKELLPVKYRVAHTAGLPVSIVATGKNDLQLDLTD